MAYKHPEHPPRPVLYPGDYPPPTATAAEIEREQKKQWEAEMEEHHANQRFEFARSERLELARERMSGPLGQPGYHRVDGPLSPREAQRELDYQIAEREIRCGLPDSPEDMPAVAVVGGMPMRFDE